MLLQGHFIFCLLAQTIGLLALPPSFIILTGWSADLAISLKPLHL